MTIYEIKELTKETSPYFFSRDTFKFFGQTLKDFKIYKQMDGRYKIQASNNYGVTIRFFNLKSNQLERE